MKMKSIIAASVAFVGASISSGANAQDYYIGEILMFGTTFCPRGTEDADGRLIQITQNTALFSIFGTIYGGDGRTTFGYPNLSGRLALGDGHGPGLSNRILGEQGGSLTKTLSVSNIPSHTHGAISAEFSTPEGKLKNDTTGAPVTTTTGSTGGAQPFEVMSPYQSIRYCVVTQGIYPSRN